MAGTTISFDTNSLQTASILTDTIDMESIPVKDAQMYALSHANYSKIPFVSYPSRSVTVSGTIFGSSITNLDSLLDAFRGYFIGADRNLDIGYNGGTRRFIATVNTLKITRPGGLAFAKFSIEFICTQPFGMDTATTPALTGTGRTLASYSDAYTFLGTAPSQLPIVTITLTAITGTTASIQWGNGGNGQAIFVQRTWTAADVLIIDCVNRAVTVNGTPVAFSGAFPEFNPGGQSMQYVDSFTTRTFTIGVAYTVRYL